MPKWEHGSLLQVDDIEGVFVGVIVNMFLF